MEILPQEYRTQYNMGIDDRFPKKIENATTTSDGLMSAEDKAKLNAIDITKYDTVYDVATWENDGLMSKIDKKKLDNIEENANNYVHPNTPEIRHVTDKQISFWDSKASTDIATQTINGLMSAADKKKLDEIEEHANNYIHPNTPEIRHVTDTQIDYWNKKASTDNATDSTNGLMSAADKAKLDGIEDHANNYIHPNNESIRHVTDAEKTYWTNKADKYKATPTENGLMSKEDKKKLDGIEEGATNYIHPDTPEMRHVTDAQITKWDHKADTSVATYDKSGLMSFEDKKKLDKVLVEEDMTDKHYVTTDQIAYWDNKADYRLVDYNYNGLMSIEDKKKLDGVEENANNYVHPDTPEMRHVTDAEKEKWNNKADTSIATPNNDGLMSIDDKKKLDGIEANANNYIHPDDENTRHVSDKQIKSWDDKATKDIVTVDVNGLMSKEDKRKLNSIDEFANNYIHPDTHPATMIVEDKDHRFVTDVQTNRWDRIDDIGLATHTKDGLMSAEDKEKVDNLIVPITHEAPLVYNEWSNLAPYTQTLRIPGFKKGMNAYIGISATATLPQMEAAANARMAVKSVEDGELTIIAYGDRPDISIPCIFMAGSSILIMEVKQFNGREEYSTCPPTTGKHYKNNIVYSLKPTETNCIGWLCIKDGEPGEWIPWGIIDMPK